MNGVKSLSSPLESILIQKVWTGDQIRDAMRIAKEKTKEHTNNIGDNFIAEYTLYSLRKALGLDEEE